MAEGGMPGFGTGWERSSKIWCVFESMASSLLLGVGVGREKDRWEGEGGGVGSVLFLFVVIGEGEEGLVDGCSGVFEARGEGEGACSCVVGSMHGALWYCRLEG